MRCQRRILHIRWHDYILNNEVLRHTGLLAASSIVRKRRLGLFGHVDRLADDVPENRILWTCWEAQDGVRPCSDWRRAEADLLPPGLSRSTETRELRWPTPCGWQKTDRSGDKSQRREATAERFACRKEGRNPLIFIADEQLKFEYLICCHTAFF